MRRRLSPTEQALKAMQDAVRLAHISRPYSGYEVAIQGMSRQKFEGIFGSIEATNRSMADALKASHIETSLKQLSATMAKVLPSSSLDLLRRQTVQQSIIDSMTRLSQASSLTGARESILESMRRLNEQRLPRHLLEHLEFPRVASAILQGHRGVQDVIQGLSASRFLAQAIPTSHFEAAYRQVLSQYLEEATEEDEPTAEEVESLVESILSWIQETVPRIINIDYLYTLFLPLMLFVVQIQLDADSEKRILAKVNEGYQDLSDRIEDLSAESSGTYYVALRSVNLRDAPNTKTSSVRAVLYPNQEVRLIKRKRKWIKVEYFDYQTMVAREGWCYKKYLMMIEPR